MRSLRCPVVLLALVLVVTGCAAPWARVVEEPAVKLSDGVLVSGRYSTQQGTIHLQREFLLHKDGRITEIQTVVGTDKFADFWRERFKDYDPASSEFAFTKEEGDGKLTVRAKRDYGSVAAFNQEANAELTLLNGPFFRSVSLRSQTGSFDAQSMVETYGSHEQATFEDWVSFLEDAVSLGYVVTDEATGETYSWERTAGQIGDGIPVLIAAKHWRSLAYWGGGAIVLFLGFVVYMGLFGRRHWDNREEEEGA